MTDDGMINRQRYRPLAVLTADRRIGLAVTTATTIVTASGEEYWVGREA